MSKKYFAGLRLPAFIFSYPFSVLFVARLYATICAIITVLLWNSANNHFTLDQAFPVSVTSDLIALLFILVSLWFTVQKFFYVKLDATLTFISLIFIIIGLISACSLSEQPDSNHIFYITICHLYLLAAQLFSIGWTLICTQNSVSRLFIMNWGAGVTQNEVELLQREF